MCGVSGPPAHLAGKAGLKVLGVTRPGCLGGPCIHGPLLIAGGGGRWWQGLRTHPGSQPCRVVWDLPEAASAEKALAQR